MGNPFRRLGAVAVAMALLALVACDLWIQSVRAWWEQHSLTGSVVSSLLVVAVTALIFDEVIASRQRRARSASMAVQGLIVYGQARRAYATIMDSNESALQMSGASEEMRTLASMLLSASSTLFDDPAARPFLAQVERVTGSMFRTLSASARGVPVADDRDRLSSDMAQLRAPLEPLLHRLSDEDRGVLEALPEV